MKTQTFARSLFVVLCLSRSIPSFAQAADPYTTHLGVRYNFLSRASGQTSAFGFNADVTRMLGGFAGGGGWGVGGGVDFEKFESDLLQEYEAYAAAQGRATGPYELSPFGRFGIGLTTDGEFSDMMLDFRGGVDFKLKPDSPFLISTMVSLKRVLADFEGFNVLRFSVGVVIPLDK